MRLLGKVKNGNYYVYMFDDGTKIRKNNLDYFEPEKPESMDLKITNKCDKGCPFCHENSTIDGAHADIMNLKFIDTLLPFTELAIGGGNPLEHPDLIPFLRKCKDLGLIPNMTINQTHFMKNKELVDMLVTEKLIYGLGVSLVSVTDEFIKTISDYPNAVIHVINGVHDIDTLKKLYDKNLKILILGYKEFRRGETYHSDKIECIKEETRNNLDELLKHFKVVSFDNLALAQLKMKDHLSEKDWKNLYMGGDGQFTMFIDAVNKTFSKSSTTPIEDRKPLEDDITSMFKQVRDESK